VALVRSLRSAELTPGELGVLRELFEAAWPDPEDAFADTDLENALGGVHFVIEIDGRIVAHASVVPRELHAGERRLATGYVEAVATHPDHARRGFGSTVAREATAHVDDAYELGALGTGLHDFYGRLGWTTWRGPTSVRTPNGLERTPDEDGFVMVRRTPRTPPIDPDGPLSCDWRPGDVW
jgi:aminoglycoside 2'-N-acetyltransferase I